jgi:hypothetical protein
MECSENRLAIYEAEHNDTALIAAASGDTLMPTNGSR